MIDEYVALILFGFAIIFFILRLRKKLRRLIYSRSFNTKRTYRGRFDVEAVYRSFVKACGVKGWSVSRYEDSWVAYCAPTEESLMKIELELISVGTHIEFRSSPLNWSMVQEPLIRIGSFQAGQMTVVVGIEQFMKRLDRFDRYVKKIDPNCICSEESFEWSNAPVG